MARQWKPFLKLFSRTSSSTLPGAGATFTVRLYRPKLFAVLYSIVLLVMHFSYECISTECISIVSFFIFVYPMKAII